MACRYPGGASSPEALWRLVAEGRDGIAEFPADRGWDVDRLYHPDPENPGTSYTREGGFLRDAAEFNPEFFSISPREAEAMDPQERLLLESCWEALEDAGIDPVSLHESQTGVFAGVGDRSYGPGAGMTSSIVSGRISYALGLEGPALSIDTACSSSLVAMHLAARALRQGECDAGPRRRRDGDLHSRPPLSASAPSAASLPTGAAKSFRRRSGRSRLVRGSGCARLGASLGGAAQRSSDARRAARLGRQPGRCLERPHRPQRTLAGAGDPPGLGERKAQRQGHRRVEGHGTGTTLGDPIEAGALLATYGQERDRPLKLGSIKSNIGHPQAAAGIAGTIKMVMAMREGVLPKTLHVDSPSTKVDWEAGEIELLTEPLEWEANGEPRRAGVSSFGISGTNAHVILEEAPGGEVAAEERAPLQGPIPLTLSAKAEPALAEAAERLVAHITQNPELDPTDIAYSLATTRSAFEHRAVALGENRKELLASLNALANGEPSANLTIARAKQGKLAYLLTGQGSQRLGMGKELYEADPHFAAAFDRACEQIDIHLEVSLKEIVFAKGKKAAERLKDTTYAQPALFAIEVALHESLTKRGLEPDLLTGHSAGEIAAAHISGVLSLPDAAKLITARGKLMGALPKGGAMLAIEATEQEATESIAGKEQELAIAGINSPTSIVLSGAEEAIEEAEDHWQAEGRKTKRLAVSHAFHSPLMEPMLEEFAEVAQSLQYNEPQIPVVSNLTGEILSPEQATDPAYWVSHAREPVRFAQGIETLAAQGASAYLELGPDPVLLAMARECLNDSDAEPAFIPTLREGRAEAGAIATALVHAHAAGTKLDWGTFFAGTGARRVPLPTYPFQRKRYWLDSSGKAVQEESRAALHRVEWQAAPNSLADGIDPAIPHEVEIEADAPRAEAARRATEDALATIQAFLADESKADSCLALITKEAMATSKGESPDPAAAAVWGLVRSATSEHPGRFALIDTDGTEASQEALSQALAMGAAEPQIALREGKPLVPRLTHMDASEDEEQAKPLDPERTVLITGGLSGLGALLARHLAATERARHLLLVSRKGPEAKGADELRSELEELGAEVQIAACDVTDPKAIEQLFAQIPAEHPLGAIVHSAGALDDGVLDSMNPERLATTMRPKADAAWHLHEQSKDLELSHFVLFSSAAGLLGGAAQSNYAAANNFLDALAALRQAEGLPATSLAWGHWGRQSNLAGEEAAELSADEQLMERLNTQIRQRLGFAPIAEEQGLALFDAACQSHEPLLAPVHFDTASLRDQAHNGTLAPTLRSLVDLPEQQTQQVRGSLGALLSEKPSSEHEAIVLDLVRSNAAAVLGYDSPADVEPNKAFQEMGLDSLGAIELRNRLGGATGLEIGATVVFDYPNPEALAEHLLAEATASGAARQITVRAQASDEPIAILGMACRYPGGIASPEDLWQLVAEGRDGITEFPADRGWDVDRLYHPDPDNPGTSYTREGGFLAAAGEFDPEFFAISPREALVMDPQERLLLESSWEALEDAGIDPGSLLRSQTGVFAGVGDRNYGPAAGMTSSIVSGRISYALGLEGPAISIDTACSSSLVAMHLASQALRGGECDLALAGGVTVISTPTPFIAFSAQRGLAPDGRCKSFAEAADGTGWSEGVGVLVLERLSEAQRNGHPVLAVLRGSAVNQDGASNGLTAPNGPSQERVIRQALANARLSPKDIDVVEGHGTGTTLGDPIEAGALLATYGQERDEPLKLGSIKSNIGHPQAAAGIAGTIKMVMAMREGVLPKTLHVDAPSSKVDWEAGEIELLTEPLEWEANGEPRRAGVSSFGISGTNAHVILEEAPALEPSPAGQSEEGGETPPAQGFQGPIPLTLSAKAEPALAQAAERLAAHITQNPDLDPTDIAYSLATTRSAFEHRAVVLGEDRVELLTSLNALANGEPSANLTIAKAKQGKLAYLLTGQGSQRLGMGKELYEADPHFKAPFDKACEQIDAELGESLQDIVFAKGKKAQERLKDTTYAQPALFAIEVALHEALAKRGLKPDLLTGHSVGEIAAAQIAGVLSLPDAAKLVVARGKLMGVLPTGGAMVAIETTEQEAQESIAGKEQELSIAGINSPTSIVLSGTEEAIEEAEDHWQAEGRKTKRLAVSHAFHSPLMEPMLEEFAEVAKSLEYHEPQIPVVSNLTGEILSPEQATDPAYWVSHAREPVRFAQGIETLAAQGASVYLELGPDPVLLAMARECLTDSEADLAFIPTLREGRREEGAIATTLAHAHAAGAKLDWGTFFAGTGARRVPLPTYPFQRKRYWIDSAGSQAGDMTAAGQAAADHPLLGAAVELAGDPGEGLLLTGRLSLSTHRWLADHAIGEAILLPGTAFLELALKAAEQAGAETVEELTLEAPLILPETGAVAIQVSVSGPEEDGRREIAIHSRIDGEEDAQWTRHATGALSDAPAPTPEPLDAWPPEGAEPIEVDYLYDLLAEHGLQYGPAFQGLSAAWREGERVYAEVSLPEELAEGAAAFGIHPALLDSALHGVRLAGIEEQGQGPSLPSSWSGVALTAVGARELRVRIDPGEENEISLALADASGAPVATVGSLISRPLDPSQIQGSRQRQDGLLAIEWTEASLPEQADAPEGVETLRCEVDEEAPSPEAARKATEQALHAIQEWLADDSKADSRLALITKGAMAASQGESPDPAAAAIWGLVRTAQSEHPARFALIDTDGSEASEAAIAAALSLGAEEPQLALREGCALAPRLTRMKAGEGKEETVPPIDPEHTVLITGATGGLGALTARHLAEHHGVRHLLLISRSGSKAEGAKALKAELKELGAKAKIAACDASDRKALARVIAQIPEEHPLGAVVHCAGVLADATVETLTAEQLQKVFAPKAEAAHNLHELTADEDLSAFVLFSSAAGALGGPGQANYAAANVYLDALAQRRGAEGKVATAIAWGLWQRGMGGTLGEADLARMRRSGVEALSDERGLGLLDAAIAAGSPQAIAQPLDTATLRGLASVGALPSIYSGLVRVPKRRSVATGSLAQKLASLPEAEHEDYVLDLVRAQIADMLGHGSAHEVEPTRAFQELGFDSLAAVELRNRLDLIAGLRLGATVIFDYPNATALAQHLLAEATASGGARQVVLRAQASDEPIAIVGMACRYPGGIASAEDLWRLVASGRDAIDELPTDRGWDLEQLYHPDPDNPGTSYTRAGGFLSGAGEFNPDFFAISPREAQVMDPQERLLLESCWEALEDAGIDPGSLLKSQTGVFAGVGDRSYGPAAGMTQSIVSGRISYALGLEGPAISIDTACSSSLVAMHLASQALRQGECDLALAGGVTVISTPGVFVMFSAQRGLAPDGRCKSFAEAADGTGWSEGVGVLVLERLSEAERNGHPILALLKGSAVNQDGASNGLTAPNGPSQERVIRQALANARLEAKDVDAVEAHGTGTTLGDPIEATALLATYGQDRDEPLKLGSIKSNIGHPQAAAGVAGTIKMVMAMREGALPKTLHVDAPSSKVDWEAGEIELLTEQLEWEPNGRPRRAGVSSFGMSGTNAHVILEEAPALEPSPAAKDAEAEGGEGGPIHLTLSAKAEPALAEAAERLAAHITQNPELDPTDIAYSLATTRSAFEHRAVVLGEDREELLASLNSLANDEDSPNLIRARARTETQPVFLFPGQGAQAKGMATELLDTSPAFAEQMAACEEALAPHVDWSLTEVLREEEAKWLDRLDIVQPALFAVMVSLAKLWQKSGVTPQALIGHSQGEIAAAHISGALSLSDAALVIAHRGKAMAKIAGKGAMLSVSLPQEALPPYAEPYAERISLAAINGPTSLVLSGEPEALKEIEASLEKDGIETKQIAVDYAAHSSQIEDLQEELLDAFSPISPKDTEIPLISTVSGEQIEGKELGPSYWYRNLRQTVLFEPVLRSALKAGKRAFIEIGPHPVLAFGAIETIEQVLEDPSEASLLYTLRRDEADARRFATSLAKAHAEGIELDWQAHFKGTKASRVPLPTYPFQRKRYWLASQAQVADASAIGLTAADHPLLGAAIEDPTGEGLTLSGRISLATHPWLADHAVTGAVLLPGTAFLEVALHAAERVGAETVEELTLQAPLVLPEAGAVAIQVSVSGLDQEGRREIEVHSRPEGADGEAQWTLHAQGALSDAPAPAPEPLDAWPPEGTEPIEVDHFYDLLAEAGLEYGPAFQGLTAAWREGERIYTEVSLPEESAHQAQGFAIHPALLDAALHGISLAKRGSGAIELPWVWSGVSLQAEGAHQLRVCLTPTAESVGLQIADGAGAPLATVSSLALRPLDPFQLQGARTGGDGLLETAWAELALPEHEEAPEQVETLRPEIDQEAPSPEAARRATEQTLEAIQAILANESKADFRLTLITQGAMATSPQESPDPAAAAIWGLVRSAQSEHPGRFALIDTDGTEASEEAIAKALSIGADEPQLALREGAALAPRLTRTKPGEEAEDTPPAIDPERTVLITGATGVLGALIARHLVERHGARHLLLTSRSGPEAEGAKELQAELEELGAKATIAACDVADREDLEKLLAQVPEEHPLGAIVHAAGALADGTVEAMVPEQIERVFAPKAEAAWHLHELTAEADLSAFILFSSAAGTLGGGGQANYAAANAYLDALAHERRAEGKPATAIAWGLWEQRSALTEKLSEADVVRMRRGGVETLSDEQGLAFFEEALGAGSPATLAVPLNTAALRILASVGALPPIFRGLVRTPRRRSATTGSLAEKLAAMPEAERESFALEFVRGEVAAVLGHSSPREVEPKRAFKELGFDSLAAVELRNRLSAICGIRLAATVVFDYPNATSLAEHLLAEATASGAGRRVAVRAQASEEPVAIVGMACRYPGGVSSPAELWGLVAEGRDSIAKFPTDRGWDTERLYDPDPDNGMIYAREGGFLAGAGDFDPEFFGISPREALVTDPQQRLLLESCWEALEDAGIDPVSLQGSQTGVFAGVMYQDYGPSAGSTQSIVSGRVAYALGLEGPAISIDTACSSSLVAMHLASQALKQGECDLALTGGVTTLATPGLFIEFSRQRALAPDGRCKSFADAADGAGFSEGVGVLVLERLSEARRKGHPVLALLRGSAVNQDGASNGLTAPNGPSQERVIRQALANARLEAKDIDAVEAHGTGTTLGDPIEAGALLATYGQDRERPLRLGSIKSNIGHTQAAAGVAGVIKMTQAMREGVLPKTLHVDAPSSKVEWESGEIELLTEQIEWESNGRPRRAGVSSFGVSGTNAHAILEEAPGGEVAADERAPLEGPIPLTLSAKAEPALAQAAERLAAHITQNPDLDPTDIAYSLATTRSAFEHRAVVLGENREELLTSLNALVNGEPSANLISAKAKQGKLAYLLTGQGSQRLGMGKELYEQDKHFAEAFDQACEQIDAELGESLKEIVFAKGKKAEERLKDTTYAQPALFAIEVALYESLAKRGLKPDLLTGHSVGEIAAAQIAGVLSLSDAAKLVVARGRLMGELPKGGAMVAIEATEEEAAESIAGKEQELAIAGINSPTSIVLSGAEEAIEKAEDHWQAEGRKTKRLAVSHAFHSPLMEPMLEEFAEVAQSLQYNEPQIPVVSNLTGEILSPEQATDPAYWVSHAREPVRFAQGIETLAAQGASAYLELGPDPVLLAMARECLNDSDAEPAFIPTLREGRAEAGAIATTIAHAHAAGAKLDWGAFFSGTGAKRVPLPTYPFQRKRYWLDSMWWSGGTAAGAASAGHPLLESTQEVAGGEGEGLLLTGRLSLSTHRWLADHAVGDAVLLSGTAFLELALRAGEQIGAETVEELTLEAPLVLPETGAVAIQVSVSGPEEDGRREVEIHSRLEAEEDAQWTRHASGALSEAPAPAPEPLEVWPPEGAEPIEVGYLYDLLAEHGLAYGPAFQGLTAAWREGERVHAEVSLPEELAEGAASFGIHPALLDAALHALALSATSGSAELKLPFAWSGVSLYAQGARELRASLSTEGEGKLSIALADATGAPVATVASLALRPVDPSQVKAQDQGTADLLCIEWSEAPLPERGEAPERVETLRCAVDSEPPSPEAARRASEEALGAIQQWLADGSKGDSRLTLITRGAMATSQEESPDPAAASVWGLVRSAQSEHPGRFALIDSDGSEESEAAMAKALALGDGEPQLALREGAALVPRLARTKAGEEDEDSHLPIDPERTVLITGATGGLGVLTARHLVERHGARHLLLISRSGTEAEGAKELQAELKELGAEATIAACDAADRKALEELLAQIPKEHPLGAVFHCAGVLADATVETLTTEQLQEVFASKADAAHHLHELTADEDLSGFVLFSSVAGTLGGPGQANYAAANVYLDALAQRRKREGRQATSIAWGLWQRESAMTAGLGEADRARMRSSGIEALSDEHGLELLDAAIAAERPQAVALPLDTAGLRALASAGALSPIFSGLVRVPRRRSVASGSLAQKLASLPEAEHETHVLDLVGERSPPSSVTPPRRRSSPPGPSRTWASTPSPR